MSEELLVAHCSPTMAGLKTGSLFTCPMHSREEILAHARSLNRRFAHRGMRVLPLKFYADRALVYVYRPARLKRDLADARSRQILSGLGYPVESGEHCIRTLIARLRESADFPHEIGLFLGYPPEDVYGFMHEGAHCAKCTGAWKVYGDEQAARCKFAQYRKCTRVYRDCLQTYNSFDRLIVAVS